MPNITPATLGATAYTITGSKGLIVDLKLDIPIFSPFPFFDLTYPTAAAGLQIKLVKGATELTITGPLTNSATFANRTIVVSTTPSGPNTIMTIEIQATAAPANDEVWKVTVTSTSVNNYSIQQIENAPGVETITRVMCDPTAAFQSFPASPQKEKTNVSMTAVSGIGTAAASNLTVVGAPAPTVQYKWTYTGALAVTAFPSCGPSQTFAFDTPGVYGNKTINISLEVWFDGSCPSTPGFLKNSAPTQALTIEPRPQNLVFVLDRSGSMSGDRWENAKKAARILTNIFAAVRKGVSPNDRIGLVVFEDTTCNWHAMPMDSLITAVQPMTAPDTADNAICQLNMGNAGWCTPIGDGLYKGMDLMNTGASTDSKFTIILLTDGYENSGTIRVSPDTIAPALVRNFSAARNDFPMVNANLSIFTIGVGSFVQEDVLNALPLPAGAGPAALYRKITDVNQIKEAISQMVGFSQNADMIVPLALGSNPTGGPPDNDNRYFDLEPGVARLMVAVEWANATDNLTLKKRDGSGGTFSGPFVPITPNTLRRCPNHGFAYVDVAALFGGDETAVPATQWQLQHTDAGGAPKPIQDDNLMIFADLLVKMEVFFDKTQYLTGDQMRVIAHLRAGHEPITDARISVELARPGASLGTFLVNNAPRYTPPKTPDADSHHPKSVMLSTALKMNDMKDLPIVTPPKIFIDNTNELWDDGAHQDGEAKDGNFANTYGNLDMEGSYTWRFFAEGKLADGSRFTRLLTVSKWVGVNVDLNVSKFDTVRLEKVPNGFLGYQIRFQPISKNKQFLGPFRPSEIKFKTNLGSFNGEIKSEFDGWYSRDLLIPKEKTVRKEPSFFERLLAHFQKRFGGKTKSLSSGVKVTIIVQGKKKTIDLKI